MDCLAVGGEWDDISEEAKDLVKRMLGSNPDSRITTGDILTHPWLTGLDNAEPEADASGKLDEVLSTDSAYYSFYFIDISFGMYYQI